MNRNRAPETDDMLPEYDLDNLPIVARGPGYSGGGRGDTGITRVGLDPDVAQIFPDEAAVNEALRTLIRISHHLPKKAVTP